MQGNENAGQRSLPLYLALALTCLLGWLFKAHCVLGGGWVDSIQYTSGCYSDAVPFWGGRGVADGQIPYFQARMEYPVLTGGLIWLAGTFTRALFGGSANAGDFLHIVTAFNAGLAFFTLWLMIREGVPRTRLWCWAFAPPLILYVGHNWDMLAVAFSVTAMLLARRHRLVAAAAAAALGVAAKLYPLLLLPLIGLQALFGKGAWLRRGVPRAAIVTLAAVAAWVAVNLPVALFAFENWSEFYRFSGERVGTAASVWQILSDNHLWSASLAERNFWSALIFFAGAATIVALGWRRHREHLWTLFPAVLAWFLLTNKVYSPQFDLWLYPLLVLTIPRLAPLALFVLSDIAAYFAEFWMFAGMDGVSPSTTHGEIAVAAAIRAFAMLWAITQIVRSPAPPWLVNATPDVGDARSAPG
ncbi:hypothetical protein KY084_13695 [Stakelama sp. CBK3Z-3]|uniref:DUF2029 domain-containing protein n=1 Tax=Stakelama flava TaxID=2860338 RepID=A0ABS6XR86_9SPHN|nr:hypothetical protein [Stakelama flava]MBW4331921.1 hypothetical protein [Stakelama flava]